MGYDNEPNPPHDDLEPVHEAYAGARWYIILHRILKIPETGLDVEQFCTPAVSGAGLHYHSQPDVRDGGPPREVEDVRAISRQLADRYGPHGFTVWVMHEGKRPRRGWL